MTFDLAAVKATLRQTPGTLHQMLGNLPDDLRLANEGDGTWSPFDIVGHLIHGEKTDWIPRAKIILSDGDKRFEPFDRFAQERESAGKSLAQLLDEFTDWRSTNLRELDLLDLSPENLTKTGIHPEFGEVTLQALLSTWAGHDFGHIYQMSRVLTKQWAAHAGPWKVYIRAMND
ncbi:MAG: DinB family protein [Bacteroidota bacterium]